MRIAVGLLAWLTASGPTSALADPPTQAAAAATTTQAAPAAPAPPTSAATPNPESEAAAKQVANQEAVAKAELDKDTQHFLAEGYRPEMRRGDQIYCRKETALGSRLSPVKNCGTIEQLKLAEQKSKSGVYDAQRQQTHGPLSR